jgi:hypothetical protein
MASIVAAVTASVFDEEQLHRWHNRTARGPADTRCCSPTRPTEASAT